MNSSFSCSSSFGTFYPSHLFFFCLTISFSSVPVRCTITGMWFPTRSLSSLKMPSWMLRKSAAVERFHNILPESLLQPMERVLTPTRPRMRSIQRSVLLLCDAIKITLLYVDVPAISKFRSSSWTASVHFSWRAPRKSRTPSIISKRFRTIRACSKSVLHHHRSTSVGRPAFADTADGDWQEQRC